MKKSIVLLVSLFFISALSILILKNLEDTNSYIKEENYKFNKIQMIVLINNLQSEISKIFLENTNSLDEYLSKNTEMTFPLKIKDSDLIFIIKQYEKVDINLLSKKETEDKSIINLFNEYNISGYDTLENIYKTEENKYYTENEVLIKNSKQLNDIIDKVIKETYNNEILKIKSDLGFISTESDQSLYEIYIKIKHFDEFSKAYYILDKKGKVIYFESSFK